MTPTQLSLKKLKAEKYHAQVVEKWNPWARIRQDLFGCIDLVGIRHDANGVFGIQATTTGNMGKRIEKSLSIPAIRAWIKAGNRFEVWGWAKRGDRGKRKTWELKEHPITVNDL